jgi:hypothetical protein
VEAASTRHVGCAAPHAAPRSPGDEETAGVATYTPCPRAQQVSPRHGHGGGGRRGAAAAAARRTIECTQCMHSAHTSAQPAGGLAPCSPTRCEPISLQYQRKKQAGRSAAALIYGEAPPDHEHEQFSCSTRTVRAARGRWLDRSAGSKAEPDPPSEMAAVIGQVRGESPDHLRGSFFCSRQAAALPKSQLC